MGNPFTDESRDAKLNLRLEGFIDQLRAPESLHRLVMFSKPVHMSVSDFALKSMLDGHLIALIVRSDYRAVYSTLVTLFGTEMAPVPAPGASMASVLKAQQTMTNGSVGAQRMARRVDED